MKKLIKKNLDELAETMPVLSEKNQHECVGGTGSYIESGANTGSIGGGDCVFQSMSYITGQPADSFALNYGKYADDNNGIISLGNDESQTNWANQYGVASGDMSTFALQNGMRAMGQNETPQNGAIVVYGDHCVVYQSKNEDGTINYYDPQNNVSGTLQAGTDYQIYGIDAM